VARTLLLVEDEPTLRETLAESLEDEGYRVVTAGDGRLGLERFREHRPDLVILDLMLPELSGMEVCRIIRRESQVPILMLTARGSEVDKVVGLEVGADDYVTKPFGLLELQARIRALLRRSEPVVAPAAERPAPTRVGDVEVDLAGHRVLRDGEELPLKPKAFELLAFLVRNPGQVFTREQLLTHVWGSDYPGETRTVDVHVHALRGAIEKDPAAPVYLHTVRGVGYVFRRPPR
jgi:DNA-binding response OmpR family regulator